MQFIDKLRRQYSLSIRAKLLLVSLSLLIVPVIGYKYIQEMEAYLRDDQEKSLIENARIVAAVLHGYKNIFSKQDVSSDSATEAVLPNHLYVRPLKSAPQMDGYAEDWLYYRDRTHVYSSMQSTTNDNTSPHRFSYRFLIGNYGRYLYAMFQVDDKHIVYRGANDQRLEAADHLQIALEDKNGKFRKYMISTHSPGRITAYRIIDQGPEQRYKAILDDRIQAVWQETSNGYNIEARIPLSLLGSKITFGIGDVNDRQTRKIDILLTTNDNNQLEPKASISIASPEIEDILSRLQRSSSRIWVVDQKANVIASSGTLLESENEQLESDPLLEINFRQIISGTIRLVYQMILKQPVTEFQDDLSNASRLTGEEILNALSGNFSSKWRQTPDEQVNILTATYPVYGDSGNVIGAVAIEETSNSVLILQNKAIEILINLSIIAFLISMVILLSFATRLSMRIRRLRDATENAIAEDGRVKGQVKHSMAGDEIGDLSRGFANMLDRLSNYNRYLETMASKLSHELRTPITVVKSSIENLEHAGLDNQYQPYTERAREGIERLNGILTRMSEATRLEQTIQSETMEDFNLETVVTSCVNGYQIAKPKQPFELDVKREEEQPTNFIVHGAPELIAQMLDKLVSNATSFSKTKSPIIIKLDREDDQAFIHVLNEGPPLPEDMKTSLFDSMVSVRSKKGSEPHLGLGLYIVRLITEFHGGKVTAKNRTDAEGAEFVVALPLKQST